MIEIAPGGLNLDGRVAMPISGETHPWRIARDRWAPVLDAVVDLGFEFVSTYVPWCVYEDDPGQIVPFLELAGSMGLKVIVRPGPNSGAELETSGWPRRVLDDPRCRALRPDGRPYLLLTATHHAFMPSYASSVVLDEIRRWYDAVIPRLAPLQHPDGPVVACQVDNEMGYHFQPHAFALDYHPEAIAGYRRFVAERYDGLDDLNAAYATAYTKLGDVEPPRDGTDSPEIRRVDWVAWKEQHLRDSVATLARMQRERGMDRVPLLHNDYPRTTTPHDLGSLESVVDVAAADVYATKEGGGFVRDVVRHLCGSSRLPWLAEMGAGWLTLPWILPVAATGGDEEHVTLRALVSGARGMNVYMLVERDRWYGSPVARDGSVRPKASLYRRLHDLVRTLDWPSLRRVADVLVVENRIDARRTAACAICGEAVPCFSQLVPLDRRLFSDEPPTWNQEVARVLDERGIDHDLASSSSLPDLARYRTVIVASTEAMDRAVWRRLAEAAAAGVRVVAGPRLPSLDERLLPAPFEPGRINMVRTARDAAALCPPPDYQSSDPSLELHLFRDGPREVLAGVNKGKASIKAKISFEGSVAFQGRWREEHLVAEGSVRVCMAPWDVQVWEVVR